MMKILQFRIAVLVAALVTTIVAGACVSNDPAPTPTPTPVPFEPVTIDPTANPDAFLAALPASEVECAATAVGGRTQLIGALRYGGANLSNTAALAASNCFSERTAQAVMVGSVQRMAEIDFSSDTVSCIAETAGNAGLALVIKPEAAPELIVTSIQSIFCLNSAERAALETTVADDLGPFAGPGTIDALECTVDGFGITRISSLVALFSGEPGDAEAVTQAISAAADALPIAAGCGLITDEDLAETGLTVDQIGCVLSEADSALALMFGTEGAEPDISQLTGLLGAFATCDIDLQQLAESNLDALDFGGFNLEGIEDFPPPPGFGASGLDLTPEQLACIADDGIDLRDVETLLSGGMLIPPDDLLAAATKCGLLEGAGSIPDEITIDSILPEGVPDDLPISAEQLQCLIDEVGQDTLDEILEGTASPLVVLPALSSCGVDLADLISGLGSG